ncbi:MAG: PAS domain S-box protein [Vicinamibacterales bacterium]
MESDHRSDWQSPQAESSLLSLLRHAVDASGEIVFLTDTSGVFTYVNRQFTVVYGYDADEVVGRATPRILKSHRQTDDFYRAFWQTLVRGESVRTTHFNRSRSGRLLTIESTSSAVREQGATVGYLAIQRDITLQREAERAAELAHVAIEHAPDAVCWFEPIGRVLYVNRMMTSLTGFDPDELRSRSLFELVPNGSREWFEERWREMVRSGAIELKTDILRKDGSKLPVEIRVTRVIFGQEAYGCALVRDVSERARLEAELLQAQKMEAIGRLAGGVAHDFNNLLTAISGYADLALSRTTDHDAADDLREIQGAVERAGSLTRQLLTFSRRQPSAPEVIDLRAALDRSLRMIGRLVGEHIVLAVSGDDHVWPVRIDPGQFDQIVVNLAVNGRDAMPKGGTLTVTVSNVVLAPGDLVAGGRERSGAFVRLTVADTGTGIPPELQSRVLEPFFTTKPAGKGTGLGLSTVYGIVEQSGGFLVVESEVGAGTRVSVHLPRAERDIVVVTEPIPASHRSRDEGTVLVVEDDESVRMVAARFLAQHGYRVLVARDVADALRIARCEPNHIDLLLTDIVMPSLNGPDLAQRIVEWRPSMRVLYVSGYADALGVNAAGGQRIAVVPKPFTADRLASAVRQALQTA